VVRAASGTFLGLRRAAANGLLLSLVVVAGAGSGCADWETPAAGYRARHGGGEVLALTPPEQFVGRAPSMPPERAEQEALDALLRQQNPRYFAPTDPPPAGIRAVIPTYNRDPAEEEEVLEAYRRALPEGWQLTTVDASGAIGLGGAVHCAALELRVGNRTSPPEGN
jgi:hypothetical protein